MLKGWGADGVVGALAAAADVVVFDSIEDCAVVCLFLSQALSVRARLTASANGLMCFMGENIPLFFVC